MKTQDDQKELFDVVDKNDNVIRQATRGEVHNNKYLIHRSIGVAVFNKKGELFLQQRSASKDTDPLFWTISCSGHVSSSFTRRQNFLARKITKLPVSIFILNLFQGLLDLIKSACLDQASRMRSTKILSCSQNLSIYYKTALRELKEELGLDLTIEPVCKYLCRAPNETEMMMLFKAESEGPFTLHKEEIIQGKFFTRKELLKAIRQKIIELSFMGKVALKMLGWIEGKII